MAEERNDANGSLLARYTLGDDLVRMDRAGVASYYVEDGLGSTRALTNSTGTVTDTYTYDAYGEQVSGNQPGTGTTNPYRFDAQQLDAATGDYYLRARFYNQADGRFLSQDPFGGRNEDPISLHRYLYTGDDPVDNTDPGGRDLVGQLAVGAIAGALAGGLADYAITGEVHAQSVIGGAIFGAAIPLLAAGAAAGVALVPGIASYSALAGPTIYTAFGLAGILSSADLVSRVFSNGSSTPGQKVAAISLMVASVIGTTASIRSFDGTFPGPNRVVLSGHGGFTTGNGMATVPPGTTFTVYGTFGSEISDSLGQAIETGADLSNVYSKTYLPGMKLPNYTLYQPDESITIMGNPFTVDQATNVSDLLQPNMGNVHWAACLKNTRASGYGWIFDVNGVFPKF